MSMNRVNPHNTAVKRIMREFKEFEKEPNEHFHASPCEDNLFEWHFTIRGCDDTEFAGGRYHGRILLPSAYPFKPPDIMILTPSGRFETQKKICLSISSFHPDNWQPSWSIRTVLTALIAFFPTPANGAIGSLSYTPEERKKLAKLSVNWTCEMCQKSNIEILPERDNNQPPSTPPRLIIPSNPQAPGSESAGPSPSPDNLNPNSTSTPGTPCEKFSLTPTSSPPLIKSSSTPITLLPSTPSTPLVSNHNPKLINRSHSSEGETDYQQNKKAEESSKGKEATEAPGLGSSLSLSSQTSNLSLSNNLNKNHDTSTLCNKNNTILENINQASNNNSPMKNEENHDNDKASSKNEVKENNNNVENKEKIQENTAESSTSTTPGSNGSNGSNGSGTSTGPDTNELNVPVTQGQGQARGNVSSCNVTVLIAFFILLILLRKLHGHISRGHLPPVMNFDSE